MSELATVVDFRGDALPLRRKRLKKHIDRAMGLLPVEKEQAA